MTTEKSSDDSYQLKEIVRSVGAGLIREKMSQYIKELRQGSIEIIAVYTPSALLVIIATCRLQIYLQQHACVAC